MSEVKPLKGTISLPGDKSISHRSAMFSVLATGKSVIENVSDGGDVASTISVLKQLGAEIELVDTTLTTIGKGLVSLEGTNEVLDCGNSGTSFRLFCGLLSGQKVKNISLVGDVSLSKRPQDRVVKPLHSIGIDIESTNGVAPVTVNQSKPDGAQIFTEIASAQVKSAILLAGLYANAPVSVIERTLTRDHTENMLRAMGVKVISSEIDNAYKSTITPPKESLKPTTGVVPGDPSSAAFFGVAAAIIPGSDIVLENILGNETRIGWIKVLQRMGADIEIITKSMVFGEPVIDIRIRYSKLTATEVSGSEISSLIDELPIISLAMLKADGTSKVRDASELRVKESDRIDVVLSHLNEMGVHTVSFDDGYDIVGTNGELQECKINSHHDHRIAMTFAIANYLISGRLEKQDEDIISTSFPSFFRLFERSID